MRILLVEDHDDTRHVLKCSLTRSGHEVQAAEDLRSGIDLLGSGDFDVIVSDIALPDGTGYALISEARRRGSGAVGIAFSAYDYPGEVLEPKVTGFDHHLNKPFDSDRLFAIVDQTAAEISILG